VPKLSTSVDIEAPPEKAWELLCDTRRYPKWIAFTERIIDQDEGDMRMGFSWKEHGGVAPFKADSEWRVTEFDPHTRMRHLGEDRSATIGLLIEIEATDGGCRLSPSMDLQPRSYMAPVIAVMWPLMMRKRTQAALNETMANAKRLLESAASES
jgi:hypothetical protein